MAHDTPPTVDRAVCDRVGAESFAHAERELLVVHALDVSAHLAECDTCRTRFAADAEFLAVLRTAVYRETAPPSLRARVQSLLQRLAPQQQDT
jgi:predicted anti-sigma-YlaC factor YlaD